LDPRIAPINAKKRSPHFCSLFKIVLVFLENKIKKMKTENKKNIPQLNNLIPNISNKIGFGI
jgi:hypothetical protein